MLCPIEVVEAHIHKLVQLFALGILDRPDLFATDKHNSNPCFSTQTSQGKEKRITYGATLIEVQRELVKFVKNQKEAHRRICLKHFFKKLDKRRQRTRKIRLMNSLVQAIQPCNLAA